MKKLCYILSWLSLALFCSCDPDNNFFKHPVEFSGDAGEPQLVIMAHLVAGEKPVVRVSHSAVLTYGASADVSYDFEGGDLSYENTYFSGMLRNATVEMQIGDGDWETLTGQMDTVYKEPEKGNEASEYNWEQVYAYHSQQAVQEDDWVNIRVSHPEFKKQAAVSQHVPRYAHATLLDFDTIRPSDFRFAPYVMNMSIQLPKYEGDETDVMCLRATAYFSRTNYTTMAVYQGGEFIYKDTLFHETYYEPCIFSKDDEFAQYDNVNLRLLNGYWGADKIGLFHQANRSENAKTISFITWFYPCYHTSRDSIHYSMSCTDSIVVEVSMLSRDAYLARASLIADAYLTVDMPINYITDYPNTFDITALFDTIQTKFDELGQLEDVQQLSNVKNGFGYVGAEACQRLVLVPGHYLPEWHNNQSTTQSKQ